MNTLPFYTFHCMYTYVWFIDQDIIVYKNWSLVNRNVISIHMNCCMSYKKIIYRHRFTHCLFNVYRFWTAWYLSVGQHVLVKGCINVCHVHFRILKKNSTQINNINFFVKNPPGLKIHYFNPNPWIHFYNASQHSDLDTPLRHWGLHVIAKCLLERLTTSNSWGWSGEYGGCGKTVT